MKFNNLQGWGVVGPDRQTGRSLGQALEYVGRALQNPGQEFKIADHFGTPGASRVLFGTVIDIITELELTFFKVNKVKLTIKYDLYSEKDNPDKVFYEGSLYKKSGSADQAVINGELYVKA